MKELEYPERLKRLGLWTLEERRNHADLIEVFKLSLGNTALSLESFFVLDTGRRTRGHSVKLRKPHCHSFIHSFVSLIMPPTTRNGHTTSNHYKQKPNPKLKITKIHEMHIAHKT